MKIYEFIRNHNVETDYEQFTGFVVSAPSEEEAKDLVAYRMTSYFQEPEITVEDFEVYVVGTSEIEKRIVLQQYNAG